MLALFPALLLVVASIWLWMLGRRLYAHLDACHTLVGQLNGWKYEMQRATMVAKAELACAKRDAEQADPPKQPETKPEDPRHCGNCGKGIDHMSLSAKYCSRRCQQSASSKRQWQRTKKARGIRNGGACVRCGSEIVGRKAGAIYCSRNCKNSDTALKSHKGLKRCPACRGLVPAGKRADAVYCSKRCKAYAYYHRNKSKTTNS